MFTSMIPTTRIVGKESFSKLNDTPHTNSVSGGQEPQTVEKERGQMNIMMQQENKCTISYK